MKSNNNLCIYHKNCADGFGAALAVKTYFDEMDQGCEFIAAHYDNDAPDVSGKNVYIVDFSYPRDVLVAMNESANKLVVLDHHKSAQAALDGLDFCIFDMARSGAVMAWNYFHPSKELPKLLAHIQDRDLWTWKLKGSREIAAALKTMGMDFEAWANYLNNDNLDVLVLFGGAIVKYQDSCVEKAARENPMPMANIAGHRVPCINTTHLISEIGNEISKGHPFAAMYFETADQRVYSLRSSEDGIDVSEVAKLFGGGGHFHAAGFSVDKPEVTLTPDK